MRSSAQFWWRTLAVLIVVSTVITACGGAAASQGPAPTAQVIEKVVTAPPVEKVVTAPPVEKQVTVQVEKQVTVAAPTAAAAPQAAGGFQAAGKLNTDVSGTVDLWHFWASPVRRNGVRRIIATCQQQLPNIKINDTVKPFGDIWTANIAAVAGGSGMPDVIVSDRPTLPKDAQGGVYMDLQPWATRDGVDPKQYYDWSWQQTLYNNDTYGIPFETDVRVLFWNQDEFKEVGLDPNKPPVTWDDLTAMADKLDKKNADGTYSRIAFFPLWNAGVYPFWVYADGSEMFTPDGKPQINAAKNVDTYNWVKKWVDRYGGWQALQNFKAKYGAPPNDLFMSGAVSMIVDIFGYSSQLNFYRPQYTAPDGKTKTNMNWNVALYPYATGAKPADWSGGFSLSIPKGAKNAAAGWEFIKCMAGPSGQLSWARDTAATPTNIKAAQDPVLIADPMWKVMDQALQVSTGGIYVPKYPNWTEQLTQREEKIWLGQTTPQAALDDAQKAVEQALQK